MAFQINTEVTSFEFHPLENIRFSRRGAQAVKIWKFVWEAQLNEKGDSIDMWIGLIMSQAETWNNSLEIMKNGLEMEILLNLILH